MLVSCVVPPLFALKYRPNHQNIAVYFQSMVIEELCPSSTWQSFAHLSSWWRLLPNKVKEILNSWIIHQCCTMSKYTEWIEWLFYYTRPLKEISAEPERQGLYFFQRSSVILKSYYPMRYILILLSNCS